MVLRSTKPGLNEEEYIALVERIQRAMCIEPFRPDVTDVVVLIGTCRMLDREIKRLRATLDHMRLLLTNAPGDTARREAIELAVHALGGTNGNGA